MCRTFRKHCCKAPHLVVSKVPGAEVRSSGQQRVLGAKAHGLQTNQEPREAEVGQWSAAPSQGRMKMSLTPKIRVPQSLVLGPLFFLQS